MVLGKLNSPDAVNLSEFEVPKRGGILYTVGIGQSGKERKLAESRGYAEYLWKVVRNETDAEEMRGVCYICENEGEVCADPNFISGRPLKMFISTRGASSQGEEKRSLRSL